MQRNMWRAVGLLLLLCFGLAGCSLHDVQFWQKLQQSNRVPETAREKVNIVFWDENAASDRTRYYRVLIKEFEKQNPDIHVEYVGLPKKAARLKNRRAKARPPSSFGMPCLFSSLALTTAPAPALRLPIPKPTLTAVSRSCVPG